ncbi:cytochrome P450 6A1 [Sodiomyces alkalinus F11]|uniref:Cytochrome P450 6A1 n=1 Tax=Sodiomyces alkalinus (strain CBS 110278 / VKM F-3762 / F11) TaxID=1314773 RepID=A0A3N2PZH8_SODAK|nr:cytochrome P450 6A1 [Sodiomyces alkalinus F11]ROT39892.1 cytochrome P450 6A1 [Sodiomyces alkalinus F11]
MAAAGHVQALLSPSTWPTSVYALLFTLLVYGISELARRAPFPSKAPRLVDSIPILGALRFFTARGQFLSQSRDISPSGQYSFYAGKKQIIGLSGPDGRRTFFESRELNFPAGYAVLFSAQPAVKAGDPFYGDGASAKLLRFMNKLLRREFLGQRVPMYASDAREAMESIVKRGSSSGATAAASVVMDPFEDMYRLVYRLTMRTVGCDEIATDLDQLRTTLSLFEAIDSGATASRIIFPWLPTLGQARQLWSGYRMYRILEGIVADRRRTGRRGNDGLQELLDQDTDMFGIVESIIASLFAGLVNSGINAAWMLCFLAHDRKLSLGGGGGGGGGGGSGWYDRVRREVDAVVARHRVSDDETPADALARLTLADWEAEFPSIDLALRETIRFTITGCGFRQNLSNEDVPIGDSGEVIPRGAFAVYHFDDVLMNSKYYPEPERWDPGRYLPGRADDKNAGTHGYIGWGSGRHPCLGMKFAKMEMAITTAMFVACFDFELCDENVRHMTSLAGLIDRNKHSASKPDKKMYLKATPRM